MEGLITQLVQLLAITASAIVLIFAIAVIHVASALSSFLRVAALRYSVASAAKASATCDSMKLQQTKDTEYDLPLTLSH